MEGGKRVLCDSLLGGTWPQEISLQGLDFCRNTKIRARKNKKAAINSSRTRAERSKALKEYSNAHKNTKKSIRADKRKYIDGLAEAAEQATRVGNMKGLYDSTKKLAGKFGNPERPVKDKTGRQIVGEEQQRKRRGERF